LRAELQSLLTERKAEKLRKGWPELPPWVFLSREGKMLDGDNLRKRVYYMVRRKAELRRLPFHYLRHAFASFHMQAGESLEYVRDQLGHSSIQVTVDIYGHLVPGANSGAADRLDTTLRNPGATTAAVEGSA
jgi:integrase